MGTFLMKTLLFVLPVAFFLSSCGHGSGVDTTGPHATVRMRDGSSVSGVVTRSSASEIQLKGDDQVGRTIPMSQVRAVEYDEAAAAPPPVSSPAPVIPAPAPSAATPPVARPETSSPPVSTPAPVRSAETVPERAREEHVHPPAAAVTSRTLVVAAGSEIPVRNEETIDSGKAVEGQTFAADVARDIHDANGDVVIPKGANARIVIRSASKGGKFKGNADLVLDLVSVSVEGKQYELDTVDLAQKGRDGVGVNKRTGEFAGGGAAVGAIIGAIAGGGKGAAIGAGSGAGAGALTQILTKGGSIKVPVETILTFKLERPLRVVASK
jgi:hypothetical protein